MKHFASGLLSALRQVGVRRIFGVPGGGFCLDVLEAAHDTNIDFVLTATENAAAIMAATSSELTNIPGVVLTAKGPGIASAINGIAHAHLDRAPILVLCEGDNDEARRFVTHQVLDQASMLQPLVKQYARLTSLDDADLTMAQTSDLLNLAMRAVPGPVVLELSAPDRYATSSLPQAFMADDSDSEPPDSLSDALQLINESNKPVIIIGLQSRRPKFSRCILQFAETLNCPVMTTYKAKGVIPETHPLIAGIFTGGAVEDELVSQADLIVLLGLDPVELIPQCWRYECPVIEVGESRHPVHYVRADVHLSGDVESAICQLCDNAQQSRWTSDEIVHERRKIQKNLSISNNDRFTPQDVVMLTMLETGGALPVTIDAGAHMFSVTSFWQASNPRSVFISNGLSTMAFALPAAIAISLEKPDEPVIAFTGDAGLTMCLGELSTAIRCNCKIIVIVLNDACLSLIDIKQKKRALHRSGVTTLNLDFAPLMQTMGGAAWTTNSQTGFRRALSQALAACRPCLINVTIDPTPYSGQVEALRG